MTQPPCHGGGQHSPTVGPRLLFRQKLSPLPAACLRERAVRLLKLHSEKATKSPCPDPMVSTVALNFQTPGYEMDLNAGRFLVNGQCGYILKPECLRQPDTDFDPESPGPPRTTLTVQVGILGRALHWAWSWLQQPSSSGRQPEVEEGSGGLLGGRALRVLGGCGGQAEAPPPPLQVLTAQQLPKLNAEKPSSIVDPLVRIEIHGVPTDCARKETTYVLNNGEWAYCGGGGGRPAGSRGCRALPGRTSWL